MREIKFRAWDKKRRVMIGSNYQDNWNTDTIDADEWYSDLGNIGLTAIELLIRDERFCVMQYTGLKDKNGKEIYEGDILRRESGMVYPVEWTDEVSCGCCNFGSGYIYNSFEAERLEVVGNIYENPELIK